MAAPDMRAIEDILLDHRWHNVDLKPLTHHQVATCFREDGRLLAMEQKQYDLWNEDDVIRVRLHDMAKGEGQQVEQDRLCDVVMYAATTKSKNTDSTQPETGINDEDDASHQLQNTKQAQSTKVKTEDATRAENESYGQEDPCPQISKAQPPKVKTEEVTIAEYKSRGKEYPCARTGGTQERQTTHGGTPGRHEILPPCYCISCLKYHWDHVNEGFPELLDHRLAAMRVDGWVKTP